MVTVVPRASAKPRRSTMQFRDVREHGKIYIAHLLKKQNWQVDFVLRIVICDLKCEKLSGTLLTMFNESFPLISVLTFLEIPPPPHTHTHFISPLVKYVPLETYK